MKKRKYQLRQRAIRQRETRERIVDATMALHEEVGPAATTISAIAERAGVQRLTVYRHFPDERALLGACSSKWIGLHPPPDVAAVDAEAPEERTRAVLLAVYGYYEETQSMWASIYRDADQMNEVRDVLAGFERYLDEAAKSLLAAWAPRRSRGLKASIGHALGFSTWQSLAAQGLGRKPMADLVTAWVGAGAGEEPGRRKRTAAGRSASAGA
jgi:AcrR family transcriptional regulator